MANVNDKANEANKVTETLTEVTEHTEEVKWYKKPAVWLKIAGATIGAALLTGAGFLVAGLLGKDDDDENEPEETDTSVEE